MNGTAIPNRGSVLISGIGASDDTALLCHTNRPPPPDRPNHSGGEWHGPDGTRVNETAVPGFRRNRSPKIVRLKMRTGTGAGVPSEGIYRCEIKDAQSTPQTVYVGLYHKGKGNAIFCFFIYTLALPLFVVNTLRESHVVWWHEFHF